MEKPQPFEVVRIRDDEVELTRENTYLYTHIGRAALYDHIFVDVEPNGAYQWRFAPTTGQESEQYNHLKEKVIENECPVHMNLKEVYPVDEENYIKHAQPDWSNLEIGDE